MPEDATTSKEHQIPTNLRLLRILEEVARLGVSVKPADLIEVLARVQGHEEEHMGSARWLSALPWAESHLFSGPWFLDSHL